MDRQTINRLLALNRAFYATFAQSFAASRSTSDPALDCILPYIPERATVLDVGCGDGRLARLLDRQRPGATYVGVDVVPELLSLARAQAAPLVGIETRFVLADVAQPGWSQILRSMEGVPPFDVVAALAVLHHIPSFERRASLLRELGGLASSRGHVLVSTWQFLDSGRIRRKIVGWDRLAIAPEALEPGDYLLDWRRGGSGLRYCHMVDEQEMAHLAAGSGLRVAETFRAGGREGNLSLFAVLEISNDGP